MKKFLSSLLIFMLSGCVDNSSFEERYPWICKVQRVQGEFRAQSIKDAEYMYLYRINEDSTYIRQFMFPTSEIDKCWLVTDLDRG